MSDRTKLEQMLQYLINEEKDKAEELFHELVVAKSREIYENLLDDDISVEEDSDEEVDESSDDEEVDESSDEEDDDEDLDESSDDEEVDEMFGMQEIGGDPADDMMSDVDSDMGGDMDDMGGDMDDMGGDEPATKDDVMDIKDALDDLKAEFEAMLAGEADDDEAMGDVDGDGDHDMDDHDAEDDDAEDEDEGNPFAKESVREYTEKKTASMGDNGANTKSIVAGKNTTIGGGGTTANIAKSFSTEKGGTQGGLANPTPKDMNTGNVNKVGGTNAKSFYSNNSKGHGTEKKGSGDNGANTKSLIGGKK
jgi:hypothetical protein